jgi:V/A-type H+-transporting ATPase subunit B
VDVLPSLSRLMKDGVGEGHTRRDHPNLASQLYALYARAQGVRSLASIVGEEELSATDRKILQFADAFEREFVNQGEREERTVERTLEIAWGILAGLPRSELTRVGVDEIDEFLPLAARAESLETRSSTRSSARRGARTEEKLDEQKPEETKED